VGLPGHCAPVWQICDMDFRRTYRSAAVSFADLVSRIPAGRWDGPGFGDRTLRELVAGTVGEALAQVPRVLGTPAGSVAVESPQAYWAAAEDTPETADPGQVSDLAGQATAALAAVNDDDVVTTPAGGMRVRDWLPTRTFTLVVHGLDIAAAADVPLDLAPAAITEAVTLAAGIAAAGGDGTLVLRALTGRACLPEGYSVR
jgi:hypothetical protein